MLNGNNGFNQWVTIACSALTVLIFAACSTSFQQAQKQTETDNTEQELVYVTAQRTRQPLAEHEGKQRVTPPPPQYAAMEFSMDVNRPHVQGKIAPGAPRLVTPVDVNRENYQHLDENSVKQVASEPVSTFSIDVDTASYSNVRRMLNQGQLPPTDAVRIEEFVNYFDFQYPTPVNSEHPFSVNTAISSSPWSQGRHLLRIGIQGSTEKQPVTGRNLVFLIDVSGSMNSADKLPLLKKSFALLSKHLDAKDKVSIVVYAGASGVVLPTTPGNQQADILQALEKLSAGGSTNGGAGIELAYAMATQAYIPGGINRVILATDGDFNVGTVNHQQLIDLIERKRETGISLSVLGFGRGNYNDHLTEQLANKGNGNAAYIDNLNEAKKVLVDQMDGTFNSIAKDVKIQVEFNPATVSEYRLIGYENRALANEDFNNDMVDAGEIGAGHRVTAVYELVLNGSTNKYHSALRYQPAKVEHNHANELAQVKIRYKHPDDNHSQLISQRVNKADISDFDSASRDFKFATAVIGFAQKLRHSKFDNQVEFDWIVETANNNKGRDDFGYRSEFVQLVRMASTLSENLAQHNANVPITPTDG